MLIEGGRVLQACRATRWKLVKLACSKRAVWVALYWACAGGAILTFDYFVRKYDRLPYPGEPPAEQLLSTLRQVSVLIDGTPLCDVRRFRRAGTTGASQTFLRDSVRSPSMSKVKNEMYRHGWSLVSEHERNGQTDYLRFCKDRISVTVDARSPRGAESVYVGVLWVADRGRPDYCP